MKKILIALVFLGLLSSFARAWPRLGAAANIVTQNTGNRAKCFSTTVGTTTAVQLFTASDNYREVLIQNTDSTYYVYCGTFSAVIPTSGPRFILPPKPTGVTTNGNYNIYCVGEAAAGAATIEILSTVEYSVPD